MREIEIEIEIQRERETGREGGRKEGRKEGPLYPFWLFILNTEECVDNLDNCPCWLAVVEDCIDILDICLPTIHFDRFPPFLFTYGHIQCSVKHTTLSYKYCKYP